MMHINWLKSISLGFYDLFLPGLCVSCGGPVKKTRVLICDTCKEKILFAGGRKLLFKELNGIGQVKYLFPYTQFKGIELGSAVRIMKYSGYQSIAKELAGMMAEVIRYDKLYLNSDMITSIPLHTARRRERGFNQTELLAMEISRMVNIPYVNCLIKKKNTKPQAELSYQERELNAKGIYLIKPGMKVDGKSVILVDDQCTSGSTLNSAAEVLIAAGANYVLGLAVTH